MFGSISGESYIEIKKVKTVKNSKKNSEMAF